jgi:N-carbamoylputrescine amidase
VSERRIKVAAVQAATMPGSSKDAKIEQVLDLITKASEDGCQVILPPELADTDYEKFYSKDVDYFELAETVPGPTTEAVGQITKKYGNYVIMPLFERAVPGVYYNAAATVGPSGDVICNYRKVHVAGVQVLEKIYFRNGAGFNVWETAEAPHAKIGTIICHDRRYPESSRIVAMLGAEIMFCPTAAPGYASGVHWEMLNRMRSVDTGMFTVYSNRAGTEWEKDYFGGSMIVDPFGEVVASTGDDQNVIVSAELDLGDVDKARIAVPTLRDMRNDLYVKYYRQPAYDELVGTSLGS